MEESIYDNLNMIPVFFHIILCCCLVRIIRVYPESFMHFKPLTLFDRGVGEQKHPHDVKKKKKILVLLLSYSTIMSNFSTRKTYLDMCTSKIYF